MTNGCESGSRASVSEYHLGWVDGFIEAIRSYVFVRERDDLLILVPNQVFRLNASGAAIMRAVLAGRSIGDVLTEIGDSVDRRQALHYFFCDIRALVSGCVRDGERRAAIDIRPFTPRYQTSPVLSEIAVTYACNMRCEFCYVGHDRVVKPLRTADMKKVLYRIRHEAEIPSVSFTGGEPTLRADLEELVRYARGLGLWTNLITNGTLINAERARRLRAGGLCSAQVSVEGPDAAVHDRITGVSGSFENTMRGITYLKEAGIPVHTNTTVSRSNLDHLDRMIDLVRDAGLTRLSMNLMIPCGAALHRRDLWVDYRDIGAHVLRLQRRARDSGVNFLWYSPVPMCHFNPIAHGLGNKACAAVTGLLSVNPAGEVLPCSSWQEPVGSLLAQSFRDIWRSSMLAYFVNADYAPEQCHSCTLFNACKGACPLFWRAGCDEPDGPRELR